ncbi:HrpE/YscL family type III secretion apparatus protein [Desulfocurvus sp.]|uniref:HrpE/YscL family type III secretion apparatus protein n=1 Tax=Desulfocurvus sp. TaxID=2871698 RepID=UPI0025C09810|nr:HrpE/YscL family type III secretion apparatus protein [Desulfocurvus sp.]MCK9239987.1 HrpE/YscL family type III secretion apparatus protein [Desulfocurvus sp.]
MGSVFLLKKQAFVPAPGTKIVKAADYARMAEANALLEEARALYERITAEAHEIFEAQKARGYEQGLEEGRLEHAEKIFEVAAQSLDFFEKLEHSVVRIVTDALERIVGEMDDKDLILRVVRSGLAIARNERRVVVRVCPEQAPAVEASSSELLRHFAGIRLLDVVADSRLKKNDCLVESEMGVVDAGVETQLAALRRVMEKRIAR